MNAFVSTFTPSLMPHDTLEAILVQRHELVGRIVDLVRESATGGSKHHTLLIGPRGIGKTHIVSLVYHRARAIDELQDRLLIAWLREEEWGISTLRDLLIRILLTLAEEYSDPELRRRVDELYQHDPDAAERLAGELLKQHVAGRTVLVLAENLGDMFAGLGEEGQQRLRAYIQGNPFFTILATAQSLFGGIQQQTSPFYGFFRIYHLEELTLEEARELLGKVARLDEDEELSSFIRTPTGRARIRAVHHLGGGNHRVYVIFSQFLTRKTLDELVEAVMQMIEKLTPYYQSRMSQLSQQQRKIVEHLCDRRGAAPVKEIAQRCFATSQAVSSTLRDLRAMGYVRSTPHGRESYYELREPLMRICIEVKKQRGQPIRLLVDFLRIWYTHEDLARRLKNVGPRAVLDYWYLTSALRASEEEAEDPRWTASAEDFRRLGEKGAWDGALHSAEEMFAIRPGAEARAACIHALFRLHTPEEALACLSEAMERDLGNAGLWVVGAMFLLLQSSFDPVMLIEWMGNWKRTLGERDELTLALRVSDTAVRYKAARDERILLELPAEERTIVRQMLGIEETEEREES